MTAGDYATMTARGYDRLTKVLRGEATMSLEDVAQAQRLLKGILAQEPGLELAERTQEENAMTRNSDSRGVS